MSKDLGFERIIKEKKKFCASIRARIYTKERFSNKDLGFERKIKDKEKF